MHNQKQNLYPKKKQKRTNKTKPPVILNIQRNISNRILGFKVTQKFFFNFKVLSH